MLQRLLLFFYIICHVAGVCRDTETCIERIKEVVAAPRRFWFGEQRSALCSHRNAKNLECGGPPQLANFHSIASRLFRVKTYHSAYLRNLNIFPRVTYRASPGHYRACEHDFFSGNTSAVEADPDMEPVEPFRIRKRPEISWSELQFDDQYTIVFTDVGYATLNFLAVDFPKATKYLKDYEPTENYRPSPNPMVVLIFRKGRIEVEAPKSEEDFDLPQFMLKNELEDDLVGLSLIVASSDPFAIEKQRLKGKVDYCHSLLQNRLSSNPPRHHTILNRLPIDEIDSWLSVSFDQHAMNANVCCQRIMLPKTSVFLDPLGDVSISALTTLTPPSISSMRITSSESNYINYHRQTRNFVELSNEKFTLAIIDAHHGHLHWLEVDIPAANLNAANGNGQTKADYVPLIPKKPSTCHSYLFVLLAQPSSMETLKPFCEGMCEERKKFRLELFKQQHGLRLSALSTVSSCYDLPYAYHILMKDASQNRTMDQRRGKYHRASSLHSPMSSEVCAAFHVSPHHKCPISSGALSSGWLSGTLVFIVVAHFL
ncbi:unnamed protein product [Caenorhabditis nigoni]|uniref:Phosphatidylinositol-glycan biosynthesis class X protein n=1 Tax=Caenorhabditis nigoni TaxID=1611254 RepID=A0A2G5URM3_9PELO|nr:hypothetical protein B9Z55_009239 [Caenorhabditis nigoni]